MRRGKFLAGAAALTAASLIAVTGVASADNVGADGDTVSPGSDISLTGAGCTLPASFGGKATVNRNSSDVNAHDSGVQTNFSSQVGSATATYVSTNSQVTASGAGTVTVPADYATNGDKFSFPFTTMIAAGSSSGSATVTVTLTQGSYSKSGSFTVTWNCPPTTSTDTSAPDVSYTLDPTGPNGVNGWYTSDVTLTWNVSDAESPFTKDGCVDKDITTDGEYEFSCTATSSGGTTGPVTATINRDATDPEVEVTGLNSGGPYVLGSVPEAGCDTTDALSGVATYATVSISGGPVGTITATCSGATDKAGNAADAVTATYQVIYAWQGFFRPIDNADVNSAKAGSSIPVKFSLTGDQGLSIFAAGSPTSKRIACPGTTSDDDVIPTVTAGNSSLSYDATTDQYNYVWKTDKAWAGTCRQLQVALVDGTTHTANFKFK